MASFNLNDLRYSLARLRTLYPKTFDQQQQYKQRQPENHAAPKKDATYGISGMSKPGNTDDFDN
jgi:hypothetical protein